MVKYRIIYKEGKNKREVREIIEIEAKNLVALYKQLEKSNINQVIEIKEIK